MTGMAAEFSRLFSAWGPQLALALGVVAALGAGAAGLRRFHPKGLGLAAVLLAAVATIYTGHVVPAPHDGFAIAWQLVFYLAAIPFAFFVRASSEVPVALYLGSLLGMGVLATATDLLMIFVGLELMSLPAYLLVAGSSANKPACEAALKYFFAGATAGALFLLGMALYYSCEHTLALTALAGSSAVHPHGNGNPLLEAALALMGAAALFKIGAVPLHFWLPDVYEGSSPELAGFFSTSLKAAAILFLMRIAAVAPASALSRSLPAVGAATMIFGALAALRQQNLRRLLAYSSIAHAGNLILGVGAWSIGGRGPAAAAAVLFYLLAYAFMNNGAFGVLKVSGLSTRADLRGLAARSPEQAGLFAVFLLALGGTPPTAGFLAKLLVFWQALKAGLYGPVAAAALAAFIALVYYLYLVRDMFFDEARKGATAPAAAGFAGRSILWACAVPSALLGFFPWILIPLARMLGS